MRLIFSNTSFFVKVSLSPSCLEIPTGSATALCFLMQPEIAHFAGRGSFGWTWSKIVPYAEEPETGEHADSIKYVEA